MLNIFYYCTSFYYLYIIVRFWNTIMKITCLLFLAAMFNIIVTDCKPLGDDGEKAPCADCEQKNLRKKRCLEWFLQNFSGVPEYRRPNVYIGNGKNNSNRVTINQAHNVYIGNGRHNENYVYYG